jgi:hypothetical protein
MRRNLAILMILFIAASTVQVHAQLVSVKTNVLMDAFSVFNGDISIATGKRTAISTSLYGSKKVLGNKAEVWGIKPEFRYWLSGRTYTGYFVGLSAMGVSCDIHWKKNIYKGEAYGGGFTVGYDCYLAKHWTLEFHGGLGAFYYRKQTTPEDKVDVKDNFKDHDIITIPYDLGVSIVYIIR